MFPALFVQQDVKFPMSLDVFDLCSEELQQKLMPTRTKFKEIEDKKVEEAAVRRRRARDPQKTKQIYRTESVRVQKSKSLSWFF